MDCYIHQGEQHPREIMEVHHIHPRAFGGDDSASNRVSLCAGAHTIVHQAALKLYSNQQGAARDMVERYLPGQPARQQRLWSLVQTVAIARMQHARSSDIPEAGLDQPDQPTVKMQLDMPDWLHHRLKALSTGQGLYRYCMRVLENHVLVATQQPGAPTEQLYSTATQPTNLPNLPLTDLTR